MTGQFPTRPPADALVRKQEESRKKTLRVSATTVQGRYALQSANAPDWRIAFQTVSVIPAELVSLITLVERDRGNFLIEQTRALNNSLVGTSFWYQNATLTCDPSFIMLHEEIMEWAKGVAEKVNFKMRYRAAKDPFAAFQWFCEAITGPLEIATALRPDGMYMLLWSAVTDQLSYSFIKQIFFQSGLMRLSYDPNREPLVSGSLTEREANKLSNLMSLYSVEPVEYTQRFVIQALVHQNLMPVPTVEDLIGKVSDLLEAFPYLVNSQRDQRYTFTLPDGGPHVAFVFLPRDGFGQFLFHDSADELQKGLATNSFRGGLTVRWSGEFTVLLQPWAKLSSLAGSDSALRVQHWLVSQVHDRVVRDYLKIENYYLDQPVTDGTIAGADDPFAQDYQYMNWVRELAMRDSPDSEEKEREHVESARIPQLRRSAFFRVLAKCGVQIEQGKGSEIKLLRPGEHPFRLGNHYGPNPRIPTVIAGRVLRRLGISYSEWKDAML